MLDTGENVEEEMGVHLRLQIEPFGVFDISLKRKISLGLRDTLKEQLLLDKCFLREVRRSAVIAQESSIRKCGYTYEASDGIDKQTIHISIQGLHRSYPDVVGEA